MLAAAAPTALVMRPSRYVSALLNEPEPLGKAEAARLCDLFHAPEIAMAVHRAQAQEARESAKEKKG